MGPTLVTGWTSTANVSALTAQSERTAGQTRQANDAHLSLGVVAHEHAGAESCAVSSV